MKLNEAIKEELENFKGPITALVVLDTKGDKIFRLDIDKNANSKIVFQVSIEDELILVKDSNLTIIDVSTAGSLHILSE